MPSSTDRLSSTRMLSASLAATALAALVFVAAPGIDLTVSAWFVRDGGGFAGDTAPLRVLRQALEIAPLVLAGSFAVLYLARRLGITRLWAPSGGGVLVLLLSLALGPGLLVNGVLKATSHRPRPVQVVQFGGPWMFRPIGRFDGQCQRNCSFVSGEGAMGFWTVAPALLAPPPYRVAAVAAALIFGTATSVLRLAFGGHFLSDTVFAALFTWLIILGCWRAVSRLSGRSPGARPPMSATG